MDESAMFIIITIIIIDLTRQTDVPFPFLPPFLLQPPIRSFSTRINVPS